MDEARIRARLRDLTHVPLPSGTHRISAVLVPLEPNHGVWLTRRSLHLPDHAGQVAFPGGKVEPSDASVEAAALREAEEEIGLRRGAATVLGRMDDHITGSGFHISPVVALLPPGPRFSAAAAEVRDIFCLGFDVLLDPDQPRPRQAFIGGGLRTFSVWPHEDHVIWGATATILRDLAARLRGAE